MSEICYLITDNGSYRPEATFSLRSLAKRLGKRVGQTIHPVSLLHSTKISADKLDDIPAEIFEPFIKKKRKEGINQFHITPMFFGPSAAILEYMPQRIEARYENGPNPRRSDPRDQVGAKLLFSFCCPGRSRSPPHQGHGSSQSPWRTSSPAFTEDEVIVSMLFASPGRHAGPGGDVAQICKDAAETHPNLQWQMTELVAGHDGIIEILADRFHQGIQSPPVTWDEDIPEWKAP